LLGGRCAFLRKKILLSRENLWDTIHHAELNPDYGIGFVMKLKNISKMTYSIVVFDWSRFSITLFGLKSSLTRGEKGGVKASFTKREFRSAYFQVASRLKKNKLQKTFQTLPLSLGLY